MGLGVAMALSLEGDSPFFVKIMFCHAPDSTIIVAICGAAARAQY